MILAVVTMAADVKWDNITNVSVSKELPGCNAKFSANLVRRLLPVRPIVKIA